jgi:hypothetical protein
MAHFAEIGTDSTVLRVIVVHNNELLDESGVEQEAKGAAFCQSLFGGAWKQTSYNSSFRKNFAGTGFVYDEARDAFIAPRPYASWILDEESCQWQPPVPAPDDGKRYRWDEETTSWIEVI